MLNHGNCKVKYLAPIIFLVWHGFALCQNYYYTCAYDSNNERGNNILISKIDLDRKLALNYNDIPMQGTIDFRVPIIINLRNRQLLIVAVNNGIQDKNTAFLDTPLVNYAILDTNLEILRMGDLRNLEFGRILNYPLNPFRKIKFNKLINDELETFSGRPSINQNMVMSMIESSPYIFNESDYPNIGGFQYFRQISLDNSSFYWNAVWPNLYLLKIDFPNRILLDSLRVSDNFHHSSLFGLLGDSLIYYFWVNYNTLNAGPPYDKLTIDPSYLIRYNASNLAKVDSIPIPNPSLDYGYVEPEMSSCDRVGPYLVYYFFEDEGSEIYSPAMLFIFDTRTNEATWLRVGWR